MKVISGRATWSQAEPAFNATVDCPHGLKQSNQTEDTRRSRRQPHSPDLKEREEIHFRGSLGKPFVQIVLDYEGLLLKPSTVTPNPSLLKRRRNTGHAAWPGRTSTSWRDDRSIPLGIRRSHEIPGPIRDWKSCGLVPDGP